MDSMNTLSQKRKVQSRSICAENHTGAKGMGGMTPLEEGIAKRAARDLGTGWKVNPYFRLGSGETYVLADIEGPGVINHIWFTEPTCNWRDVILRIYWDGNENPSVECPLGDFFCMGWGQYAPLSSLAVCVNPGSAFNCYWKMPFRKRCLMTVENRGTKELLPYYQIDYTLEEVPEDEFYFHAQFRRVNPLPYKQDYTILDGVKGCGKYVGTYMAWGVHSSGWWGEGEIKFYIDGDKDYPTICGTGTEDYFCGSCDFEDPVNHDKYLTYTTPYAGLCQAIMPNTLYRSQMRFGLYRWHITDPIYFDQDLKVTIQALGWRSGGRYLPLQDDIASVAFWYQSMPFEKFPKIGSQDDLEIL